MSKKFLGAASLAALMSMGLAACGQENAEYSEADETNRAEYAETQPLGDETDDLENDDMDVASVGAENSTYAQNDPYDQTTAYGQTTTGVPNTGGVETTENLREGPVVAIADIRVKDDVEEAATTAFEQADANGDGMLDRSEYMMLAMSAEPSTQSYGQYGETGDSAVEPQGDTTMTAQTDVEIAEPLDAAFEEAAGEDSVMTKEELRTAFLARFEEADVDGDAQLNDEEQQTFAALTVGERKNRQ